MTRQSIGVEGAHGGFQIRQRLCVHCRAHSARGTGGLPQRGCAPVLAAAGRAAASATIFQHSLFPECAPWAGAHLGSAGGLSYTPQEAQEGGLQRLGGGAAAWNARGSGAWLTEKAASFGHHGCQMHHVLYSLHMNPWGAQDIKYDLHSSTRCELNPGYGIILYPNDPWTSLPKKGGE